MIADAEEAKIYKEIYRLSGKKGWPFLEEGQLELVRCAKRYARDIPHLNGAITKLSETLDHCPDARQLRVELVGDAKPNEVQRCVHCEDSGTMLTAGTYVRCSCQIGRIIPASVLGDLNDPRWKLPVPTGDTVTTQNSETISKALVNPITAADVEREVRERKSQALGMASQARRRNPEDADV